MCVVRTKAGCLFEATCFDDTNFKRFYVFIPNCLTIDISMLPLARTIANAGVGPKRNANRDPSMKVQLLGYVFLYAFGCI